MLASVLGKFKLSALYASDLNRTMQTAAYLADATGLTIRKEPRLRERRFGVLEGLTLEEIRQKYPDYYEMFISRDNHCSYSGGETKLEFKKRVLEGFAAIAHAHPGERVAVITHGGAISRLLRHTLNLPDSPFRPFHIANGAINIFEYVQERWLIKTWGWSYLP